MCCLAARNRGSTTYNLAGEHERNAGTKNDDGGAGMSDILRTEG